jgi:hypothetical protein
MNISKNILLTVFITTFFTINCFGNGDKNVNILTDMVQQLTKKVRDLRDRSININTEKDTKALKEVLVEVKGFANQLHAIKNFVEKAITADPNFKNKLNDEAMPPRIIEGELELSFRYDLEAIGLMLAAEASPQDKQELKEALWELTMVEFGIYNTLENLQGPLITFNNLEKRYKKYGQFIIEEREGKYKDSTYGKRYTAQEAHVVLHIAAYVTSVEEALDLAKYDGGRHLYYLLKTYVDWLPEGTHMDEDVEIIKAHGSIMSITDRNGRTMLDWTKELKKKAEILNKSLKENNKPSIFMDKAIKKFTAIEKILTQGITKTQTGEIKKIKTRSPDTSTTKLNSLGFKIEKRPATRAESLDLATEQELSEVAERAQQNFPPPAKTGLF